MLRRKDKYLTCISIQGQIKKKSDQIRKIKWQFLPKVFLIFYIFLGIYFIIARFVLRLSQSVRFKGPLCISSELSASVANLTREGFQQP